jgi:hypothetical protein
VNDERSQQDQKSRGMQMPLHTETMYGHPSAETVARPARTATDGSIAVLDVRQRVSNISGEYTEWLFTDVHGIYVFSRGHPSSTVLQYNRVVVVPIWLLFFFFFIHIYLYRKTTVIAFNVRYAY